MLATDAHGSIPPATRAYTAASRPPASWPPSTGPVPSIFIICTNKHPATTPSTTFHTFHKPGRSSSSHIQRRSYFWMIANEVRSWRPGSRPSHPLPSMTISRCHTLFHNQTTTLKTLHQGAKTSAHRDCRHWNAGHRRRWSYTLIRQ